MNSAVDPITNEIRLSKSKVLVNISSRPTIYVEITLEEWVLRRLYTKKT